VILCPLRNPVILSVKAREAALQQYNFSSPWYDTLEYQTRSDSFASEHSNHPIGCYKAGNALKRLIVYASMTTNPIYTIFSGITMVTHKKKVQHLKKIYKHVKFRNQARLCLATSDYEAQIMLNTDAAGDRAHLTEACASYSTLGESKLVELLKIVHTFNYKTNERL